MYESQPSDGYANRVSTELGYIRARLEMKWTAFQRDSLKSDAVLWGHADDSNVVNFIN